MDLMIDCMPLYEMIEDDMKNIINCSVSSSSSSPSCLSDEEQLALTSCSMFDDLFFLSIQQPQQQQQQQQQQQSQYIPSESEQQQQQQQQQQATYSNLSCVSNDTLVETLEQMTNETADFTSNNQQRPVDNNNNTNQQYNNNNNFYSNTNNSSNFNDSFCSFSLSSSSTSSACSPISTNSGGSGNGNGASPLSLSLSSSSLFDALANTTFSSPSPSNTNTNNNTLSLNTPNSVGSSNTNSTCSSALSSPSTTPLSHQYNNFNSSTSSISGLQTKQDSQVNSKYMDSIYYNNVNLYHVINPMDLNRNYNQQQQQQLNSTSSLHEMLQTNSNDQLPAHRIKTISIPKQQLTGSTYSHQVAKRGKFSHNSSPSNSNHVNSDGESSLSNESDSNSSIGSSELSKKPMNAGNDYSKPLIIATKIESFQLKNVTNFAKSGESETNTTTTLTNPVQPINVNTPATQINLIKINGPKENTFYSTNGGQFSSNSLKVPVTTKINSLDSQSPNHKTIIQYKQLVANNGLNVNKPQQQQQQAQSTGLNTIINLNSGASLTVNNGSVDSNAKVFPKPPYSYSCLIAMALRNSDSGNLPVSDIYEFIIENFPYYKTARDGWKNSIRHNLSLNKCFEKIENPTNGSKKGCLWALNPDKCKKLEEECKRCRQRDPVNIRLSMSRPDDLNKIERGEQRLKKFNSTGQTGARKPTLDNANNNNTAGSNMQPTAVTTNGQISLSPAPSNNGSNNQQQQQISLSDDSFLLDWTNKNSSVILKEEDQYFDDSDIKFDPILLTGLNQSTRNNI